MIVRAESKIMIQDHFVKILNSPSAPAPVEPKPRDVKVAMLAFSGSVPGAIRDSYRSMTIQMIGESVRRVRDAMRAGKCPEIIAEKFPEVVEEQSRYAAEAAKLSEISEAITSPNVFISKLQAITRRIISPPNKKTYNAFLDRERALTAP